MIEDIRVKLYLIKPRTPGVGIVEDLQTRLESIVSALKLFPSNIRKVSWSPNTLLSLFIGWGLGKQ
ncbi:hypothetical protein SLEP1_g38581 [Rubroshorea leprosula]|uniref:Uncharacterized protein n=1 Tax=Rubroshorea leprosula TaxID=152421 RepID=A0AAV5KXQ8_9ROSI|nr:hypothetical protein SLEP1_g38581 [Rubroshorea leprosula]